MVAAVRQTTHECRSRARHERTGSPCHFSFGLSSVRSARRASGSPELSFHDGGRPNTRVTSPPGGVTAGCPIILPANCAAVTSTLVFLDWQPAAAAPGGAAQVQLSSAGPRGPTLRQQCAAGSAAPEKTTIVLDSPYMIDTSAAAGCDGELGRDAWGTGVFGASVPVPRAVPVVWNSIHCVQPTRVRVQYPPYKTKGAFRGRRGWADVRPPLQP